MPTPARRLPYLTLGDLVDRGTGTRSITVLVADDSASMRALVRITLTSQGWQVVEAETAEDALARARDADPDLAILDVTFGDTGPDGLAVCAELKADPKTAHMPIVVLTAHDDAAERRRAEAAGANAFVGKPFGPLELMRVLRDLLPQTASAPALGVFLLDAGAIEPNVLERALVEQRELTQHGTPKRLGDVLLSRGSVTTSALDRALLEQSHARSLKAEQTRARVLVVDDHAAVREGLKALIRGEEKLEIVGEAADAQEGLRLARRHQPDVVILDNEMPGGGGLGLLPQLRAELPLAKIVMFSLDHTVRERALAAGAHAFVPKDAPMGQILDALQPTRRDPVAPTVEVTPARLRVRHHLGRAALVIAAILVLYIPAFFLVENVTGASAGVFAVVPVVLIGALLGPEAGLVGAVVVLIATLALEQFTGHHFGEPMLAVGEGPGAVMILLIGFGAGALQLVRLRVDPHERRVHALAAAAIAVAGADRGQFVGALLEAMLRVGPGRVAALFENVGGEARFVSGTQALTVSQIESLAPVVRDVMRAAAPRTLALGAEEATDLRAALMVPVSVPGQEVRGAVTVLGRDAFTDTDIATVRPFAQQIWMAMRSGPISPSSASPAPASVSSPRDRRSRPHA